MLIQKVALKDVKCFALHGFYPEEQLIGNHFLVNVEVDFYPSYDTEDIENTVNYEVLNDIILNEMGNTQKLLETVVRKILDQIVVLYPFVLQAKAGIKKLNPAMKGDVGYSFVELSYTKGI
jgi:dihydroneopterin aldolase